MPKTLANKRTFKEIEEEMKLGIVAQRPNFITPYKSIKHQKILAAQGLSGFGQKCIFT